MIRRKSDNAIECVGFEENELNWITKKQFLYLAYVDLNCREREVYLKKSVASLNGDNAVRL